jgi:hypothetical protein
MTDANAAEGFSGLLEWSEPVIFDRLLETYRARLGGGGATWKLARLHTRTLRALMRGEPGAFEALRCELIDGLIAHGVGLAHIAEADSHAMRELLAIVVSRFSRSTTVATSYHLALMDLATRLPQLERHAA